MTTQFNPFAKAHHRLQIHSLTNYPASNLNRDDLGRPKECAFGGVKRLRISSQCLKRAIRTGEVFDSFREFAANEFGASPMVRNRQLKAAILADIAGKESAAELTDADAEKIAVALVNTLSKAKEGEQKQLIAYSLAEVGMLVDLVIDEKLDPTGKNFDKDLKKLIKEFNKTSGREKRVGKDGLMGELSPEMQLFGRMVTNDLFADVDSSLVVNHAMTTHGVSTERDYWVAVGDGESNSMESKGADMLDVRYFGSGVYYGYSALDIDLLVENIGKAFVEASREERVNLTVSLIEAWLWAFNTTSPNGYKTSFGHQTPAYAALMEVGQGIPFNASRAFESPVQADQKSGYVQASKEALVDWDKKRKALYQGTVGAIGDTYSFGLTEGETVEAAIADVSKQVRRIVEELTEE